MRAVELNDADPVEVEATTAFAASGTYEWDEATLALDPATGVLARQVVDVTGAGYSPFHRTYVARPAAYASVQVCRAVADPDPETDCVTSTDEDPFGLNRVYPEVSADGEVDGPARIERWLDLPDHQWDCAVDGCTVALTQDDNPVSNRVPITFAPEWAPFASADAFVTGAYEPVAGRKVTPAERASLISGLSGPGWTAAGLLESNAFNADGNGPEVTRLFRAYFGRGADTGGLRFWIARMDAGTSPGVVAKQFAHTAEFRDRYDQLDDADFVDAIYRLTLSRAAEPAGRDYWVGRIRAGLPRWAVARHFSRLPEFHIRSNRDVAVTQIVYGLTGEAPDAAYLAMRPRDAAAEVLARLAD